MFRGARRSDLEQILEIYAHARKAMADSGNPTQWGDSYPPQEMLEEDIDSNPVSYTHLTLPTNSLV